MNSHFDVWVLLLAVPAVAIMIYIIGKWLFTPVNPKPNQSNNQWSQKYEVPTTERTFSYSTKKKEHSEPVEML